MILENGCRLGGNVGAFIFHSTHFCDVEIFVMRLCPFSQVQNIKMNVATIS